MSDNGIKGFGKNWEESYCELEIDISKEYHQTEMQKMSTSRLLSTRSKGELSIQISMMNSEIRSEVSKSSNGGSILKEVSQANEITTFGEVTDAITKDISNKTTRHEKFKAHKQKLYKDAIMWKQIVRSEQIIDNSEQEANFSQLTTIFEESEKENETRHTATYDDNTKEVSTIATKDKSSMQTEFGTSYVNRNKVSSIFDSCS